jgi:HSP20 family protein
MANETPSRDNASRQQSGERAQSGTQTTQQGSGASTGSGNAQSPAQRTTGQADYGKRAPTGQAGRGETAGGTLQRRGSTSMSPYSTGFESGYGGSGPFAMMRRISDEMDRLFENFGMGRGAFPAFDQAGGWTGDARGQPSAPSMWAPHIEVSERDGKLLVQADLPGIKREDINVQIEQDAIIIQGHRHQEQSGSESGYYRSERSYGSFYRTIPLPEGTNAESASASFRDGVLRIELDAPREQQRGRKLEVRDGG